MSSKLFQALVVREKCEGGVSRRVEARKIDELPAGELLIRVRYSSLNYKDALSASGHKGVTKQYPHTPGIDAAGVVESSDHADFPPGREIIVTGRDLGMNTSGGFGEYIRVPASWAVGAPAGLTLAESMAYGTAGFTAGLSLLRLVEDGIMPDHGEILVTGATGGVGSLAIAILAQAGYRPVAATGKADATDFLMSIGAVDVIGRKDVSVSSNRVLGKGRWAGVVDTMGGSMLDAAIRTTKRHGTVACCGMILSGELSTSIFPFIIRGISLRGIDSAETPMDRRLEIWNKLANEWKPPQLDSLVTQCGLADLNERIDAMLSGRSKGRVRIHLQK